MGGGGGGGGFLCQDGRSTGHLLKHATSYRHINFGVLAHEMYKLTHVMYKLSNLKDLLHYIKSTGTCSSILHCQI